MQKDQYQLASTSLAREKQEGLHKPIGGNMCPYVIGVMYTIATKTRRCGGFGNCSPRLYSLIWG
jgi:hypothetical protein